MTVRHFAKFGRLIALAALRLLILLTALGTIARAPIIWQLVLLPAVIALFVGRYALQLEWWGWGRDFRSSISPTIAKGRTEFALARERAILSLRRPPSIALTLVAMLLLVTILPFQLAQLADVCIAKTEIPLAPATAQAPLSDWEAPIFFAALFKLVSFVLIEEFGFRGWLLFAFRKLVGAPAAVLATSYVFALAHFPQAPSGLPFLFAGVVFGTAVVLSGSIWTAVALHFSYNVGLQVWGGFSGVFGSRPISCESSLPIFLLMVTALFWALWAGRRRRGKNSAVAVS